MEWSKKISRCFMVSLLTLTVFCASGQGIKQWFSQKSTQKEYLLQQIAALKVYTGYLQKGYKIVNEGLHTIGDIKDGHWHLDKIFFDSLKVVSGTVRRDKRIQEIIRLQSETTALMNEAVKMVRKSEYFQTADLNYIQRVCNGIREGEERSGNELEKILQNGTYQMSDDERLKRIESIYRQVKERYDFVQSFYRDLKKMEVQKRLELKGIDNLKKIY